MNKNQGGFSAIEGLLLLIIAGLVGFTGWYVYKQNNAAENQPASVGLQKADNKFSTSDDAWTTFKEPKDPTTSFKYPKSWKLTDIEGVDFHDGNRNVAVTSPSGSVMVLKSTGIGIGDSCLDDEHSITTYSKKISGAKDIYVVDWELLNGSESLAKGTDILSSGNDDVSGFVKLGDHKGCITNGFRFSSSKYERGGYWFGTNHSPDQNQLKEVDNTVGHQILESLTVQ